MKNSFVEYVITELLAGWPAEAKAMFGGYGIKIEGVTMAMIVDDVLYFKVDESNKADYEKYDMLPFTYHQKGGKPVAMSYYEVPPTVTEDPKLLKEFVEKSLAIAKSKKHKK